MTKSDHRLRRNANDLMDRYRPVGAGQNDLGSFSATVPWVIPATGQADSAVPSESAATNFGAPFS